MKICRTIPELRALLAEYRAAGNSVALVPTMGALHDGHLALVDRARLLSDRVIATIFVNPAQFDQQSDLAAYPRDEERDLTLLQGAGVHAVLIPTVEEIYPEGDETIVETTELSRKLHGAVRPGHFRGVTTVVARLFNIVQPDFATFGEKDYQQLQVIRRMVRDLHFPVQIEPVPTVREDDGLAMSSRNVRLESEDRSAAAVLNRALTVAQGAAYSHPTEAELRKAMMKVLEAEPRAKDISLDIVQADSLEPLEGPVDGPTAIMISARFGDVLLIDQKVVSP